MICCSWNWMIQGRNIELWFYCVYMNEFFCVKVFYHQLIPWFWFIWLSLSVWSTSLDLTSCLNPLSFHFANLPYFRAVEIPDAISNVRLSDLYIIATLGVGGFGRVELVSHYVEIPCGELWGTTGIVKCPWWLMKYCVTFHNWWNICLLCSSLIARDAMDEYCLRSMLCNPIVCIDAVTTILVHGL